ncbi:hypothetical protein B0H14DRAFT_2806504 [Mycena olivaceomarginata]|nr:hypothetical protein B0H14DRAFT_2806504 [Mycena olivaceomarginata]
MHPERTFVRTGAALGLTLVSIVLAIWNIWLSMRDKTRRSYSYLGDDFPEFYMPVRGDLPPVAMTMEETRHTRSRAPTRSMNGPPAPRWATAVHVRLGPEYRGFAMGMFHELHCLHVMRLVLGENDKGAPADVLTRDFETDRVGATHVCKDWSMVYDETADNWWQWEPVKNSNGTVPTSGPT